MAVPQEHPGRGAVPHFKRSLCADRSAFGVGAASRGHIVDAPAFDAIQKRLLRLKSEEKALLALVEYDKLAIKNVVSVIALHAVGFGSWLVSV